MPNDSSPTIPPKQEPPKTVWPIPDSLLGRYGSWASIIGLPVGALGVILGIASLWPLISAYRGTLVSGLSIFVGLLFGAFNGWLFSRSIDTPRIFHWWLPHYWLSLSILSFLAVYLMQDAPASTFNTYSYWSSLLSGFGYLYITLAVFGNRTTVLRRYIAQLEAATKERHDQHYKKEQFLIDAFLLTYSSLDALTERPIWADKPLPPDVDEHLRSMLETFHKAQVPNDPDPNIRSAAS